MVLGVYFGHHLFDVMTLDFIHSETHDTAGAEVNLSNKPNLVLITGNVHAWRPVGAHCTNVVHVIMHRVSIKLVLLDVGCVFRPCQEVLTAIFIVKNFYEELGIELKGFGYV